MPPQITAQLAKLQRSAAALSLGQKVLAVIGVGILVLGGTALFHWVSKPTYAPLFNQLAGDDASAITDQLTADGVPFQLSDGGATILVPVDQVDAERIKVAAAGLPKAAATGYSLLDAEGVTSSQFQQKVTYQRAVEGELARTIEGIDGVDTAVVHLAIPEQTVFTDSAGTPTASVLVDTRAGKSLSADQVQAVVHLVSASVPGLDADQVTVSDEKGQLLSQAGQGVSGSADDETAAYDTRTAAAVQAQLDRVLGAGKSQVTVNAELDYDQTQRTTETFSTTPGTPPLSSSTSKETYGGGSGTGVGGALGDNGVLGMDGEETSAGADGTGDGGYVKEQATQDNAVNKVTENTQVAPGGVRRQSVSVVVDATAAAKAGIPQLQQTVATAAGVDTTRGDTVSLVSTPFDTTAADQAEADLAAAKADEARAQQVAWVKQGAIGLLALVLLVVLFVAWRRAAKKREQREPVDLGELERLYAAQVPQPRLPEAASLPAAEATPQLVAPEPDPASLRRAEFGQLVDSQPAEVADLLRGWLTASKKG